MQNHILDIFEVLIKRRRRRTDPACDIDYAQIAQWLLVQNFDRRFEDLCARLQSAGPKRLIVPRWKNPRTGPLLRARAALRLRLALRGGDLS